MRAGQRKWKWCVRPNRSDVSEQKPQQLFDAIRSDAKKVCQILVIILIDVNDEQCATLHVYIVIRMNF